jgi:phospholipid-binding lipoprotein MlaA
MILGLSTNFGTGSMHHRALLKPAAAATAVIALVLLAGCASTPTASNDANDPLEGMNRSFYDFNDALDRNFFEPVARGYVKVTPDPVRSGVTNFFGNVNYLNVIANDLLQGKLGDFASDTGRFVVNSTVGVGGLFDPATPMGLKEHDEDLGQGFGTWGVGEGAYLVLPLMGPNTFRDLPGAASSILLNPLTYLNVVVTLPLGVVNAINTRANLLEASSIRDQAALDPYTFVREAYRQQREFKIFDGNPPGDEFEEYVEDDSGAAILKVY